MDIPLILARLVHVLGGIFWVGAFAFVNFYLIPAMAEAGPDGARVMGGVMKRKYMQVMLAVSILTILSGLWLYWKASMGFDPVYMRSGPGHAYGIGGAFAIIAFLIGVLVTRPSLLKAMALTQQAAGSDTVEKEALMAEAGRLRARGASAGKVVTVLILLAAGTMAVGRYV